MAIFQAGNRQIDKTQLENVLVQGINPYIETYQGVWGRENTDAVRQAYSQLINAIHDDKVSMNIDGSLNIKDGSIVNSPNKKGFDPVAKAAYFITDIINRIPEYKEPEPEPEPKRTYDTDTFARNFASYLAPPGSNVNIGEVWANLDDEIEDKEGNRTRPYTNRLAAFNQFLDQEIANLDSYNDFNEYWGDKEKLRARLIDLKSRLADGDISKQDMLELSRMGFRSDYFDQTGTPLTEEELAAREAKKTKLAEEEAAKKAKIQAMRGILKRQSGIYGTDASQNATAYQDYLAKTYGTGANAFNLVNAKAQELLNKVYAGTATADEKRQLGNFIHYIRTNNPTYRDQVLNPEELAELGTYSSYIKGKNVFRLPWKTQDNRYIYSDNAGNVYFLKPNNGVTYKDYGVTPNEYKQGFLTNSSYTEDGSQKAFSSASKKQDYARIASFIGDVVSLAGGWANVGGTGVSLIGDWIADSESNEEFSTKLTHAIENAGFGVIGLLPGAKISKFVAKYGKQAHVILGLLAANGIITEGSYTYSMLADLMSGKKKNITSEDIKHLTHLGRATTGAAAVGRSAAARNKWGDLTQEVHSVKTSKGKTVQLSAKEKAEIEKIGNSKGQKAANEKFKETAKAKGTKLAEDDGLVSGTFKESPTKFDAIQARRIPYTQVRPMGNKISSEKETIINPNQKERFEKLYAIRQENKSKFNPREFGWGRGKENPGKMFDIYTNGFKGSDIPKVRETISQTSQQEATTQEIRQLINSPVPNRIVKMEQYVQSGQPEQIRAARTLFENTKTQMHPDQAVRLERQIAQAEARMARETHTENVVQQNAANIQKARGLAKSGGIDDNIANAYNYIKGNPKLTPLLDKLIGKTSWPEMAASPEFKKLTRNQKLVLQRAYDILFERSGGIIAKHQIGGIINKFQNGGVSYSSNSSWYNNVFLPNLRHIISELSINGSKYAKWINSMQGRHSNLYNQAKTGDFLKSPWTHEDVGSYQSDYKNDPLAFRKRGNKKGTIIGYNEGIGNAIRNNRYIIASKNPTSGDWNAQDYTVDSRYSGITDDRRILGRENDFTEEQLKDLNTKLNEVKHFVYLDKDKYYKLGYIDDNGIKKVYDGDTPYIDQDRMQPIDILGTAAGTNPDSSKLPTEIHIGDSSSVRPEGTELNPFKQDTVGIIQEGLLNGLKVGQLLANIRATNANYRDFRNGLNQYRPSDYTQNYHQVMDDYAGNQFVAATAAKLQNNLVPVSSDKNFNEARALERELKAAELMHQQAVQNQKTIQQHTDLAEKYGNANREARVNTANENSKMFFNIAMQDAQGKQSRRLGNMTSLNNFWSDAVTNIENKLNQRTELMDAWKANRLGDRTSWIKNKVLTDSTYQKLVEEYKVAKQNKDTKRQQELVPLITQAQRDAGAEWDQLYAQVYNLPYYTFTPRYQQWVEGLRVATPTYHKRGGRVSEEAETEREKLRVMRANDDRFMRSIWKAIDLYIQQIKNK